MLISCCVLAYYLHWRVRPRRQKYFHVGLRPTLGAYTGIWHSVHFSIETHVDVVHMLKVHRVMVLVYVLSGRT